MPECGFLVIGDRTLNFSVDDIVDVSNAPENEQEDILNLIKDNVLKEIKLHII